VSEGLLFCRTSSYLAPVFCIWISCLAAVCRAADDDSMRCGPGIYCVERMFCIARLSGAPPPELNPNFFVELLTMRSIKLVAKDKTVTDSVLMKEFPVGIDAPNVTIERAMPTVDWTAGDLGVVPLVKNNKVLVITPNSLSIDNDLTLTINSSSPKGNYRLDKLSGSENVDSTAGPYKLNFECVAHVVDAASLVVNEERMHQ
jgi:hypothetical protein